MVISFDIIRELHRKERESRGLQKLPEGFFEEVGQYLEAKEKGSSSAIDMIELENAKLIINDLIDRREHKIIEGAMVFVRSGILLDNMTDKEKELFNNIVELLRNFREEMWAEIRGRKIGLPEVVEEERKDETVDVYLALKDLATFIWSDGKRYNIRKNDILRIPDELASFLEQKGVVRKAGEKHEVS